MLFLKKNIIWIICFLSFFTALFYNQLNLNKLPDTQKRENTTVITKDDYSYLNPAETYLKTGEWKQEGNSMQSYFLRPPGYGIFYLFFLKISNTPLLLLKLAQILLFSCSVFWLYSILSSIFKHNTFNLTTTALYALTPFFTSFLSYTLTEGVTPALTLLFVYLLIAATKREHNQQKNTFYLLAATSFSILLIIRPPLGFLGALLPIFIITDYWKTGLLKTLTKLILFGCVAFSIMGVWQFRNYKLTGSYVGLHAIYYPDNNSIYRPTFQEYWNFVGGWAQEGAEAHSYMVPMWKAAIKGDTSEIYIKNAIATFPKKVVNHIGTKRLSGVFRQYQEATLHQKKYYDKNIPMPLEIPAIEIACVDSFKAITNEFKKEFWFDSFILAPLKVFKIMSFHSNLSAYIFQNTYRGNWLIEFLRVLFFGIHSLCFLMLLMSLFCFKTLDWRLTAINITVFCYLFYLCYFQRGIEERYTLPILALLLINLSTVNALVFQKIQLRRNPR